MLGAGFTLQTQDTTSDNRFDEHMSQLKAAVDSICTSVCDAGEVEIQRALLCDQGGIAHGMHLDHEGETIVVGLGRHTVGVGIARYEAEVVLEAGDMVMLPKGVPYSIDVHPNTPWNRSTLHQRCIVLCATFISNSLPCGLHVKQPYLGHMEMGGVHKVGCDVEGEEEDQEEGEEEEEEDEEEEEEEEEEFARASRRHGIASEYYGYMKGMHVEFLLFGNMM